MKPRLISATQLALALFLVIILTSCSTQPSQAKINNRPKIKENWTPTKITLYRAPSSFNAFQPSDAVEELEAKKAVYELVAPMVRSDGTISDGMAPVTLITFADPRSGRVYIGFPDPFFAETKSGIFGFHLFGGNIEWEASFVDVSTSTGGIKKAISRFEKEVNLRAILDDEHHLARYRTDIYTPLGEDFFHSGASSGGTPDPRILGIKSTGQIVELKIESPMDKSIGRVWVDLETHKVVKVLRDGTPPPPPYQNDPRTKKIKENWFPTKITLYRSPSSFNAFQPSNAVEELEAKKAVYDVITPLEGERTDVTVVTFSDPRTGKVYIGLPSLLFVETKSGIFGINLGISSIEWESSLIDMSASGGGTKEASSRFEKEIDLSAILWNPERAWSKPITGLSTPLGWGFFEDASSVTSGSPFPKLLRVNISGQILELELENYRGDSKGSVWVDLETRKVVKALRDGQPPPPQTTNNFDLLLRSLRFLLLNPTPGSILNIDNWPFLGTRSLRHWTFPVDRLIKEPSIASSINSCPPTICQPFV